MFEMNSKYGTVKVYAETIEDEAVAQVTKMANSPLGENAHIRIMPDAHAGAGCTIGTTMVLTDKVCPNLVGVDIGCGVTMHRTSIDFTSRLDELDAIIRKHIPFGFNIHSDEQSSEELFAEELRCWEYLSDKTQATARRSMGTLGGGNHFIEAYKNGWLAVHSGSRNIGLSVAKYYQTLAETDFDAQVNMDISRELEAIPLYARQDWLAKYKPIKIEKDLMYLKGQAMYDYLNDAHFMSTWATMNRLQMIGAIVTYMHGTTHEVISSTHNYIGKDNILRKGAICADQGKRLVIPLNMRDGMLVCIGKGNEDWNNSAPHGAGRLYSRSKAKERFTVEEYAESMKGIYTTCVSSATLDEAPFAYKDYQEIMTAIEPTVEIVERLTPIYNFKAN